MPNPSLILRHLGAVANLDSKNQIQNNKIKEVRNEQLYDPHILFMNRRIGRGG